MISRSVDLAVRTWGPKVAEDALLFERRWTVRAVRLFRPELAAQFETQLERYNAAMAGGTAAEIDAEGARTCRAYAKVAAELATAQVTDDSYLIGHDPATGLTIAIGACPAAAARVAECHGVDVQWYSPDDVAILLALHDRFKFVGEIKRAFPGAQIEGQS